MRFRLCCAALCLALVSFERATAADTVAAVIDLVGRDDADFRAIGLDRIRHAAKGEAATRQFANLLANQPAERQAELLRALADRGAKAAIPPIASTLAAAKDPAARAAAVVALGALGGGAEVALLTRSLAAADPEKAAARRALTVIRGDEAVTQLIDVARSGEPGARQVHARSVSRRRISGEILFDDEGHLSLVARIGDILADLEDLAGL